MPDEPRPIRADLTREGLTLETERLARKLAALPAGAPVVAMVHGWRYAPAFGPDCPHGSIMSLNPQPGNARVISWPRHLHLDGRNGLAIGLGWQAKCGLWTAHARARIAGLALAAIAEMIQRMDPDRPLHVIAHSLGARVALNALTHAKPGQFGRLILLAPSETRQVAAEALATPAGMAVQVVNVTTRENDLFDAGYEWGVHLGLRTSLGQGLGRRVANWRDLWIDHPDSLAALAAQGFVIPKPTGRVCHWSPYLRPGTMALYRALLTGQLPLSALPDPFPQRRWARFLARPALPGLRLGHA
jgi:uncharacterized membrane protein